MLQIRLQAGDAAWWPVIRALFLRVGMLVVRFNVFLKCVKGVFPYLPGSLQIGAPGFSSSFSTSGFEPTWPFLCGDCSGVSGQMEEGRWGGGCLLFLPLQLESSNQKCKSQSQRESKQTFSMQNSLIVYSLNMQYVC